MSETRTQFGIESLTIVTLPVPDQGEALDFYTGTLGFETRADETFEMEGGSGRWVTVGLPGQELEIALVNPDEPYYDDEARDLLTSRVGTETWWTFSTDDCQESVAALETAGVEITEEPREYPWGVEATFADPFGNEFSLFEYAEG